MFKFYIIFYGKHWLVLKFKFNWYLHSLVSTVLGFILSMAIRRDEDRGKFGPPGLFSRENPTMGKHLREPWGNVKAH